MEKLIREFLKARKGQGLLRELKSISSRGQGRIKFSGKSYFDFSSNDYLGLSDHPYLIEQSKKAIEKFGVSSSSSRLLSGTLDLHRQLEENMAKFKKKQAAIVFNSGYQANLGIISSLCKQGDCIFADRLIHASLIDGILLSGAKFFRFQHNDANHLEALLKKERNKFKNCLIITESIFSMDGDKAPLKEFVSLKEKYQVQLFVDEAHATGIFGKNGAGLVEELGLEKQVDLIMGTFSKALGGFGGYLAASKKIVDYLVNTCRSFIYSTALPPGVIAANLASLELIKKEPQRRIQLLENAAYLHRELLNQGFVIKGESQIVPLIIGDNLRAVECAKNLQAKSFWVLAIRPPTVPIGQARLRFSLNFYQQKKILDKLIHELKKIKF
ncbi:MAG: 8-amino-7-oxononanoate synthase [Candidatus Omnitrophica bacterium]|nr:8-amino-7-oxononanoate synthase [Candidatus Omnitrophota bacterium]